ncbi:MAG: hypothetical protein QXP03_03005 [Desulfurococcaceae archaeon]
MATAKQKHTSKMLARRYGTVGVIAGRYIEAGFSVKVFYPTRYGLIQVVARKGGVFAIDVFDKGTVTLDAVKALHEKAKLLKAKPIVVLYGGGVEVSNEARSYCEENGIRIRRVPRSK